MNKTCSFLVYTGWLREKNDHDLKCGNVNYLQKRQGKKAK